MKLKIRESPITFSNHCVGADFARKQWSLTIFGHGSERQGENVNMGAKIESFRNKWPEIPRVETEQSLY